MFIYILSNLDMGAGGGAPSFEGTDVLAAVEAWWNATAAVYSLTRDHKLWFLEAPENTLLPYATFFLVAQPVETWTTGFAFYRAGIQINLHCNTAARARSLAHQLRVAFKGAPLSVNNQTVCHVLPDGNTIQVGTGLGPGGKDCWVATETFDIPFTE